MIVLLLGKSGQLGRSIQEFLPGYWDCRVWGREELDFERPHNIAPKILGLKPDIIINAAAFTDVDGAEERLEIAHSVNNLSVQVLASVAYQVNALLVHYSTDYVFDGFKAFPYTEIDETNPLGVYGNSKLLGEQAIQNSGCRHLIFRSSWIYSAYGNNFVKSMLKLAKTKDELRVVNDQFGGPTSAKFVARISLSAIEKKILPDGIYHLSSAGSASWYELAKAVIDLGWQYGLKLKIKGSDILPITTDQYPTLARRPIYSTLNCQKLFAKLDENQVDWYTNLDENMTEIAREFHDA